MQGKDMLGPTHRTSRFILLLVGVQWGSEEEWVQWGSEEEWVLWNSPLGQRPKRPHKCM